MQQQITKSIEGKSNSGGPKYARIGVLVLGGLFIAFMIAMGVYRKFGG